MREYEFFFAPSLYREHHQSFLAETSVFLSMLFNALSSWALGQTVNRTSCFMLAGIATSKLVKSPLLVFHATLGAQLQAFKWEKLVRLIQTQRHAVWQSSTIITTTHTLSTQTQRETLVSANASRLHKKTPQENAPEKMFVLYREDFT